MPHAKMWFNGAWRDWNTYTPNPRVSAAWDQFTPGDGTLKVFNPVTQDYVQFWPPSNFPYSYQAQITPPGISVADDAFPNTQFSITNLIPEDGTTISSVLWTIWTPNDELTFNSNKTSIANTSTSLTPTLYQRGTAPSAGTGVPGNIQCAVTLSNGQKATVAIEELDWFIPNAQGVSMSYSYTGGAGAGLTQWDEVGPSYDFVDPDFSINMTTTATGAYIDKVEMWLSPLSNPNATSSMVGEANKLTKNTASPNTNTTETLDMQAVDLSLGINVNESVSTTVVFKGYDTLGNTAIITVPINLNSGIVP